MRIRSGLIGLVMGFGVAYSGACDSGSSQPTTSCVTDYDCKGDRVCENGVCSGGSSGNSGNVTYTCESGAQMIVDECCESAIEGCSDDFRSSWFNAWRDECLKYVEKQGNPPQDFFECSYLACNSGEIEGRPNYGHKPLNDCEQKHLK